MNGGPRLRARPSGFTLIEVLVALAIAAIGLAAVLSIVTHTASNAASLHERTFAGWIASNRLAELRLSGSFPSVDRSEGELDYANSRWRWEQVVTQTDVPGLRRVDVRVRRAEAPAEAVLATVSGFVGRTQVASLPSGVSWAPVQAGGGP